MALIDALYIHSLAVTRKARASDGQGGWTETWGTVATISGRIRPASANERILARQQQAEISHVFYCAASVDVTRGDRLAGEGRTWDVIAVREPSHARHHLEIDCLERQIEGQP